MKTFYRGGVSPRLPFLGPLLLVVVLLLLPKDSHAAVRFFGVRRAHLQRLKVLNPLRWIRGDTDMLRARIQSLEEELSKLHMDHAILLDRLRQIQAKRVKEYGEQQRAALSTNKEVKKVTERLRAEAAEQVRRVESRAAKEKEELEARLLADSEKRLADLRTKLVAEADVRVEKAVKKAVAEQNAKHKTDIEKLVSRHREELEKAREALEKAKAAAGLEMNQDYQSRLNRASKDAEERLAKEMDRHSKELAAERRKARKALEKKEKEGQSRLSELESEFKKKEVDLLEKVKRHQEEVAQLQTELGRYKRTSPSSTTPASSNKRARSSKAPPQPSFKVNKS